MGTWCLSGKERKRVCVGVYVCVCGGGFLYFSTIGGRLHGFVSCGVLARWQSIAEWGCRLVGANNYVTYFDSSTALLHSCISLDHHTCDGIPSPLRCFRLSQV